MLKISIVWAALAVLFLGNITVADAQKADHWSSQARIPMYDNVTNETPPLLLADQNRTVHAFNSQLIDDDFRAIVYRKWTIEQGWTEPIDILLNPSGDDIQVLDALQDQTDTVHLVLAMNGDIFHSSAALSEAGHAQSWAIPTPVAEQATYPFNAGIGRDSRGNLAIVYAGNKDGSGLYVVYSSDKGGTWSVPEPIFLTTSQDLAVLGIKAYSGNSGQLHAVWSVVNSSGQGQSGHYARVDIARRTTTLPVVLDTQTDDGLLLLGILTPAVVEYEGTVLATYYNGNVNGHWWRRSDDGGATWSAPARVAPRHVGSNGAISFVIDSGNTLHIFFGERIDDQNHGMWHSIWSGNGWSEPDHVIRGPQVRDRVGGNGFDPKSARAVVSQGNTILVTWATDGIAGENGIWYSDTVLDTPELPLVALSVPLQAPTRTFNSVTAHPTPIAVATPKPPPPLSLGTKNVVPAITSPRTMLMVSLLPTLVLVVLVVGLKYLHSASNR